MLDVRMEAEIVITSADPILSTCLTFYKMNKPQHKLQSKYAPNLQSVHPEKCWIGKLQLESTIVVSPAMYTSHSNQSSAEAFS